MSDIKVGDRVRVTFEGVVKQTVGDYGARIHNDAGQWLAEFYYERDGASLEKIEPPVEVFKPGDVVRDKRGGSVYLIRKNGGFVNLTDHSAREWDYNFEFTSKFYEKVNLAES